MTARYVTIGQFPDVRIELRGKLSEILVSTANPGTFAMPEDVPGCFLEMGLDGKWTGASVGSFGSIEELNALPTTYLAIGARASVLGVQYTYGVGGWANDHTDEMWWRGRLSNIAAAYRRNGAPPRIAITGDSNVAGKGGGTGTGASVGARVKSFAYLIAKSLGWQTGSVFGDQNIGIEGVTYAQYDPRVTMGSWTSDTSVAITFGGRFFRCSGPSVTRWEFTPEEAFDKYTISYPTYTVGTRAVGQLQFYLDGVLVDTVNPQTASNRFVRAEFTCPLGIHTISIGAPDTAIAIFHGVETVDTSSNAPIFLMGGWSGALMANLADVTQPYAALNALVALDPDYVLTYCTINDVGSSTLPYPFSQALERYSRLLAGINCDQMYTVGMPNTGTDTVNSNVAGSLLAAYAANLKTYAQLRQGAFCDSRLLFGPIYDSAAMQGLTADFYHPNAVGQQGLASLFLPFFTGHI